MSRRTELVVVGLLALAAVAVWALVPTYPNYDAYYHLVWGRELVDGVTPTFQAYAAPTEHPLYVGICAVLGVAVGEHADRALVLFCALSLVALVWAVFRLARTCFGAWPGVAAAVFVGSSFSLLLFAAKAYVDVPFLAVVLWAGAIEAARPARRRPDWPWLVRWLPIRADPAGASVVASSGRLVMALLTVAGLLRPEAWVIAGLYWLWCGWRRWDLFALMLVAPLGWAAVDAAVTGDPLFSLHSTSQLADALGRERGIVHVPGAFVSFLSSTARPPVAAAGVIGMVLAVRDGRRRSLHVPFALFLAGTITFVGTGLAGLAILPRYLTVPSVALCLFAGFCVLGFVEQPAGSRLRRRWGQLIAVGAVLGVVFVVAKLSVADRLVTELRYIRSTENTLAQLLHDPAVTAGARCGPITFPNYRLVPDTRWILDLPADRVGARSDQRHPYGVAIFTVGHKTLVRYGYADGASRTTVHPDPGYHPIARSPQFAAWVSCPPA